VTVADTQNPVNETPRFYPKTEHVYQVINYNISFDIFIFM